MEYFPMSFHDAFVTPAKLFSFKVFFVFFPPRFFLEKTCLFVWSSIFRCINIEILFSFSVSEKIMWMPCALFCGWFLNALYRYWLLLWHETHTTWLCRDRLTSSCNFSFRHFFGLGLHGNYSRNIIVFPISNKILYRCFCFQTKFYPEKLFQ